MRRLGVLALQGDFAAHAAMLCGLGADVLEVRRCAQLPDVDGLVIPGGESSALLRLMSAEAWFPALRAFHDGGGALLGTCAGAILLAREVEGGQPSAGLLDATVARNAYGRQVDSFEAPLQSPALGGGLHGIFIRAPRFVRLGADVQVLARWGEQPVLVRQGRLLAATFHPELTEDVRLHRLFLDIAA